MLSPIDSVVLTFTKYKKTDKPSIDRICRNKGRRNNYFNDIHDRNMLTKYLLIKILISKN